MIRVYRHPNTQIRSYLLDEEIAPHRVERFVTHPQPEARSRIQSLGPIASRLVTEILAIPGIREIFVKPREIIARKEEAFPWDEVEPRLLRALESAARRKGFRVLTSRNAPPP